jgi:hypothetical protein
LTFAGCKIAVALPPARREELERSWPFAPGSLFLANFWIQLSKLRAC